MKPGRPLRVVHFVTGGGTGSTRVALDLTLLQARDPGVEPHLLLRSKGGGLPSSIQAEIDAAGLSVHRVPNPHPRSRVVGRIAEILQEIRPDVFFAHGYSEHLWGRRAAIRIGVPYLVHVEHNEERYLPWRRLAARRLALRTAATVCVSSGVRDSVLRLGIESPRVEVLHNGIDSRRFRCDTPPEARSPDIVMAARFARKKDQATLIRAARILADGGWEGRLILAGGGKEVHRNRCRKLAAELGIADRVEFPGRVEDLPVLFAGARVAALSSHQEGFGLVLVEAMAAGCAVVASRIPGIVDVVRDGETGWLFEPGDPASAASALRTALAADDEARLRIARGKEAAAETFSLEGMAARYRAFLESLTAGGGCAPGGL